MPAIDNCQPQVIHALEKDGWRVFSRQSRFVFEGRIVYIDLHVNRQINGSREELFLAEVKCFADDTQYTHDLYTALGQVIMYRGILDARNINIPLYLVIPHHIYLHVFDSIAQNVLQHNQVGLLVINLDEERVVTWKP